MVPRSQADEFDFAGLGLIGGVGAWIRGAFSADAGVVAHELGHNYGLNHANFWDTAGKSVIGAGQSLEYGDIFDTMGGSGGGIRQFNARYKSLLNWLPSTGVQTVTTNGTYTVAAHDDPEATGIRAE